MTGDVGFLCNLNFYYDQGGVFCGPTWAPTKAPTEYPTKSPTKSPTKAPTAAPTSITWEQVGEDIDGEA